MTRKYSLMVEGDAAAYSAYVPELPAILITGTSIDELLSRAPEAIRLYLESVQPDRSPAAWVREIEVEVPA